MLCEQKEKEGTREARTLSFKGHSGYGRASHMEMVRYG